LANALLEFQWIWRIKYLLVNFFLFWSNSYQTSWTDCTVKQWSCGITSLRAEERNFIPLMRPNFLSYLSGVISSKSCKLSNTIFAGVWSCIFLDENISCQSLTGAGIAPKGWTVRGSNTGGGEIFRTLSDRLWGSPNLLYNGYSFFPGGKAAGAWRYRTSSISCRG